MEDSRSNNIQERAKEAKKTWSGSRSGPWLRLSIPAKMNPNSLLLEAVDVARVARDALGPAKDFDKKAKRAGLLALYKTNEDMVKDFSNNVKYFGDVDVVACTDGKEEMFKELEKGIKEKEGCWCYWAHDNAQFPTKSFFMYTFMDMVGKTPPLVDENRATRALVVCVAIEGIRTGKTGRKLDLLEELKRASSGGFRMWCALTAYSTVGEKEAACFSDMKIPTLFQLTPMNGSANASTITTGPAQIMPTILDESNAGVRSSGQKRKRTSVNAGDVLNPKRPMTEEQKEKKRSENRAQRQKHLDAEANGAKLEIYFRYDHPGSKLKDLIDSVTDWQLRRRADGSSTPDDDLRSWQDDPNVRDGPLPKTLTVLRNNHLKWLCYMYWKAVCKLRMRYCEESKISEWSPEHRDELIQESCRQWLHSAGPQGSHSLGASCVLSLLRHETDFVDIVKIATKGANHEQERLNFNGAVIGITADYSKGLSKSKLAESLVL